MVLVDVDRGWTLVCAGGGDGVGDGGVCVLFGYGCCVGVFGVGVVWWLLLVLYVYWLGICIVLLFVCWLWRLFCFSGVWCRLVVSSFGCVWRWLCLVLLCLVWCCVVVCGI